MISGCDPNAGHFLCKIYPGNDTNPHFNSEKGVMFCTRNIATIIYCCNIYYLKSIIKIFKCHHKGPEAKAPHVTALIQARSQCSYDSYARSRGPLKPRPLESRAHKHGDQQDDGTKREKCQRPSPSPLPSASRWRLSVGAKRCQRAR